MQEQLLNGALRARLQTRSHDLALMPPNRRRVLLKLLALRTVLGDALYDVDLSVLDQIAEKRRETMMGMAGANGGFVYAANDDGKESMMDLFADIDFDSSTSSSTLTPRLS